MASAVNAMLEALLFTAKSAEIFHACDWCLDGPAACPILA